MPSTPLTSGYTRSSGLDNGTNEDSNITDELNVTDMTTAQVLLDLKRTTGLDVNVASSLSPSLSVTGADNTSILSANSTGVVCNKDFSVKNGNTTKFSVSKTTEDIVINGVFFHHKTASQQANVPEMTISQTTNYTGGNAAQLCSTLRVENTGTNHGIQAETGILTISTNACPTGYSVGYYCSMTRAAGGGHSYGNVTLINDSQPKPSTESVGNVIQCRCISTGNNNMRIGTEIIVGDGTLTGSDPAQMAAGVVVSTVGANTRVKRCFTGEGNFINILDSSLANCSGAAINMGSSQLICFNSNRTNKDLYYDPTNNQLVYQPVYGSLDRAFFFNNNGTFTINTLPTPITYTAVTSTGTGSVTLSANKP